MQAAGPAASAAGALAAGWAVAAGSDPVSHLRVRREEAKAPSKQEPAVSSSDAPFEQWEGLGDRAGIEARPAAL
ncbi:hypothetical protein GCM10010393_09230 [Streptomyces gobitricini]|uniref:Uncharacterized protein n=1 Tax=Streptomyces gobitricini TaxID=68211 RepID=A0ABN3LAH4_9ACTN